MLPHQPSDNTPLLLHISNHLPDSPVLIQGHKELDRREILVSQIKPAHHFGLKLATVGTSVGIFGCTNLSDERTAELGGEARTRACH